MTDPRVEMIATLDAVFNQEKEEHSLYYSHTGVGGRPDTDDPERIIDGRIDMGRLVDAILKPEKPRTYHDLHLTMADLPRTSIMDLPYNVRIECTRVGGWQAWHRPWDRGELQLLAGEYDGPDKGMILDVAGYVLCDSLTPQTSGEPA